MSEALVGTWLDGKYRLLEVLASGGMGVVYKAEQPSFDRLVAIKLLHGNQENSAQAAQRLAREGRALSALKHPNIITTHALGLTESGELYLVMELLDGQTLAQLVTQKGALEIACCEPIFSELLDAVVYAHAHHVLHRDIKPSNVFIATADGGVKSTTKLMDFGLAMISGQGGTAGQRLTQTGAIIGSPAYMSPEQLSGGTVDERSDIYSIGCLMYECLSGVVPFAATTAMDMALRHIHEEPRDLPATVPDGWKALVLKCLEKDPALRFQSVAELKEQLALVINDGSYVPLEQKRTGGVKKSVKRIGRSLYVKLAATVFLIGAGAVAYVFWPHTKSVTDEQLRQVLSAEGDRALKLVEACNAEKNKNNEALKKQAIEATDRAYAAFKAHPLPDKNLAQVFIVAARIPDSRAKSKELDQEALEVLDLINSDPKTADDKDFLHHAYAVCVHLSEMECSDQHYVEALRWAKSAVQRGDQYFNRVPIAARPKELDGLSAYCLRLARLAVENGDVLTAQGTWQLILKIDEQWRNPEDRAADILAMARAYVGAGRLDLAEELLKSSSSVGSSSDPRSMARRKEYNDLMITFTNHDRSPALDDYTADQIRLTQGASDDQSLWYRMQALYYRGIMYTREHRFDDAVSLLKEAVEICRIKQGAENCGTMRMHYAESLYNAGKLKEALEQTSEAIGPLSRAVARFQLRLSKADPNQRRHVETSLIGRQSDLRRAQNLRAAIESQLQRQK